MESLPDYYAALHVGPAATQREISRAYRALMRTHHPDVDGSNAADRKAQDNELLGIMQAFAVLRDPVRRAAYDRGIRGQSARGQDGRGQGNKGYGGTSRGRGGQETEERETEERETAGWETAGRETAGQGSSTQAGGRRFTAQNTGASVPQDIPVRKVRSRAERSGHTIRITPVRWESGPWA